MSPTIAEVKKQLPGFDTYSKKNGVFTVRKEFFYTHGVTTQDKVNKVKNAFPQAEIIHSGEVWKPFRGGANTANSSHWFVKFTLPEN